MPRGAFMFIGGALADHIGPRRVLATAAIARAILVPGLLLVLMTHIFAYVYLVQALIGVTSALYYPADSAMLPRLGLDAAALQQANATLQIISQSSSTVAPAAGGIVVAVFGGNVALVAAAGCYLLSAGFISRIPLSRSADTPPMDEGPARASVWRRSLQGLTCAAGDRPLASLLVTIAALNVCTIGLFTVGMPSLVREVLHARASVYGFADASFAFGALLSAAALRFVRPRRQGPVVLGCTAGVVCLLGLIALVDQSWQLAAIMLTAGSLSGVVNVLALTQIQLRAPRDAVARVMAVVMFSSLGLAPASQLLAGWIAHGVGIRALFAILAAASMAIVGLAGRNLLSISSKPTTNEFAEA